MKRKRILPKRALLLVTLAALFWLVRRPINRVTPPKRVYLATPKVLLAKLPFDSTQAIAWSPDGAYIAVSGSTPFKKRAYEIVVVSVASRRVIAHITTLEESVDDFRWTAGSKLWVPTSDDGWDVYHPPFKGKIHVPSQLPRYVLAKSKYNESLKETLIFTDPGSQTSIVAVKDEIPKQSGNHYWSDVKRDIEVWQRGRRVYKMPLTAREEDFLRQPGVTFSPDASRVVITITGNLNAERKGSGEIWILDLRTGKLRFLHSGKEVSTSWFTNSVQDVSPSWNKSGKSIMFGDREFGVEEMDVATGKCSSILPAAWGGSNAAVSSDGSVVGFQFEQDCKNRAAVVRRDGMVWACVPEKFTASYFDALAWHPTQNVLAWAAFPSDNCGRKKTSDTCSLYTWRIQPLK